MTDALDYAEDLQQVVTLLERLSKAGLVQAVLEDDDDRRFDVRPLLYRRTGLELELVPRLVGEGR